MAVLDILQKMFGQSPVVAPQAAAAPSGDPSQSPIMQFLQQAGLNAPLDPQEEQRRAISRGLLDFGKAMSSSKQDFLPALAGSIGEGAGGYLDTKDASAEKKRTQNQDLMKQIFGLAENESTSQYRDEALQAKLDALAGKKPAPPKWGVIGEDQFGSKKYGYPPAYDESQPTAQPIPQPTGSTVGDGPSSVQGLAPDAMNSHGEDFISLLDPATATQVKAIIEGRAPYPTGMMLKTPYGQKLAQFVTQADPTFESANSTARAKVQADYSTGTLAKTNNALNTAIGHIKELSDTVDALGNYDQGDGWGPLTSTLNTVKNSYKTASGDPAVTNFKSVSGKVAEELTRAYRGAGGNESDIQREIEILNNSNSPTQLHEAISTMADLLESKIKANEEQYSQVMGPMNNKRDMVSEKAKRSLDIIRKRKGKGKGKGTVPPATSTEGPTVGTIEDGHEFIGGDPADPASWRAVQ